MVGGAFWWAKNNPEMTNGEVTLKIDGPIRSFIQVEDKNRDGIADWQEALAPKKAVDLDGISSTTPYVPKTKTGEALLDLTEKYLTAKANGDTTFSSEELLNETSKDLASSSRDKQYTKADINLRYSDDSTSLRNYGNAVVEAIMDHPLPSGTRNELEILNDALIKDNEEILKELDPIIEAYSGTLADMLVMPVPQTMAVEHLALTNVYRAILEDIKAFREVFNDAMPSMLRTRRYPADNIALYTAITNMYQKLDRLGIKWSSEDIASTLIKVE